MHMRKCYKICSMCITKTSNRPYAYYKMLQHAQMQSAL